MSIVFFGTPVIAAKILEYLITNKQPVAGVVTMPDRPVKRKRVMTPPPVKFTVQSIAPSIPIYQPEKASDPDFIEVLKKHQPTLFIVVAYGQIFKENLLKTPSLACVNVHFSLLPKYRGAAPLQRCIMDGDSQTGITIMHMAKGLDTGDMIKSVIMPIDPDITYGALEEQICPLAQTTLLEAIELLKANKAQRIPQDDQFASYAKKVEKEDCEIFWDRAAKDVYNLIRGVDPKPGAWSWIYIREEKKRFKVIKAELQQQQTDKPGQIISYDLSAGFIVACKTGAIRLKMVQLEGKQPMTYFEFIKGYSKDALFF